MSRYAVVLWSRRPSCVEVLERFESSREAATFRRAQRSDRGSFQVVDTRRLEGRVDPGALEPGTRHEKKLIPWSAIFAAGID